MSKENGKSDRILRKAFRLRTPFVAYAQAMLRDPVAAEDVVQEAFLVAIKKLNKIEEGTSVLAWVKAMVRLEILTHRSCRQSEVSLVQQLRDDAVDSACDRHQHAHAAQIQEQRVQLQSCLERLRSRSRHVPSARFRDNLSYGQLAVASQGEAAALDRGVVTRISSQTTQWPVRPYSTRLSRSPSAPARDDNSISEKPWLRRATPWRPT